MSLVEGKKIIGLSVETTMGDKLGVITNFDLDIDSQSIIKYYVKGNKIIKKIVTPELIINRGQVVSINNKKMIVDNLSIAKEDESGYRVPSPAL